MFGTNRQNLKSSIKVEPEWHCFVVEEILFDLTSDL